MPSHGIINKIQQNNSAQNFKGKKEQTYQVVTDKNTAFKVHTYFMGQ